MGGMTSLSNLPSIDALLRDSDDLIAHYGQAHTVRCCGAWWTLRARRRWTARRFPAMPC